MNLQQHNRVQDHLDEPAGSSASEAIEHYRQVAQHTIEESPMLATLAGFGAGLAVGALIGAALADTRVLHQRRTAETLGHRVLAALSDAVPNTIQRHVRG